MKLTIIYSFGGHKLSKQAIPPTPSTHKKKKKNWKKPVIHLGCHLRALVFSRMPWFQVSKISFSNR